MRVLVGAGLATAGAQMAAPFNADVPVHVEGGERPIHVPVYLVVGTIDEVVTLFRANLQSAFASALEAQKNNHIPFVDAAATGLHILSPDAPAASQAAVPPAATVPAPPPVPATVPAADIPQATELVNKAGDTTAAAVPPSP